MAHAPWAGPMGGVAAAPAEGDKGGVKKFRVKGAYISSFEQLAGVDKVWNTWRDGQCAADAAAL